MKKVGFGAAACLGVLLAATGCGSDDSGGGSGGSAGTGGAAGSGGAAGNGGAGAEGPLALQPGEVAEVSVTDGTASVALATPAGNERYVLILASTDLSDSGPPATYTVSLQDSAPTAASVVTGCSLSSSSWVDKPVPNETPPSGTGATVGEQRSIDVPTPSGKQTITAEAVAVAEHSVVWADVTPANPAVIDPAVVQEFLTDFENTILPRARSVFGVESDEDGDGHVQLVFSPVTKDTAVAFFSNCDLKLSIGCAGSNKGEYLYLTPPNAIDPPYNTPAAIKEILAHELSHMIHFNRKVLKTGVGGWSESAYMIEGVGAFAQDVLGYQAGNFYVTKAGLDDIDQYSLGKTLVDGVQYDLSKDGVLRGGSYLFVRWFYDRAGGDFAETDGSITSKGGPALLHVLLDSPESISTALPKEAGSSMSDLATDFWTTLAMSNREEQGGVAPVNACFAYLPTQADPQTTRQRGANLYTSFHGQQMQGPKVTPVDAADGELSAGGADFLEVDAAAGQDQLSVSVTLAGPARVRLGRIQ